jgi:nucleoside-diphosphate-sugar epimerase
MQLLLRRVQPTPLLHFAWVATPGVYLTSIENQAWVASSLALVEEFLIQGGRRLVVAGSVAEYDWSSGVCHERATPCRPTTQYGVSKHALFKALDRWSAQAKFSFAEGRLVWVYGPGEAPERVVPAMILASTSRSPFRLQYPKRVRDYLHVSDAGAAFAALLGSDVQGAVNIGSGQGIALQEFARLIGEATGQGLRLEPAEDAAEDPEPRVVADVTRLTHEVKWTPTFHPASGIRQTVSWWQARLRTVRA